MLGTLKTLLSSKDESETGKPLISLTALEPGTSLIFSETSLLSELRGKKAMIQSVRTYRFSEATTVSYTLSIDSVESLVLTIAEDDEGYYLGVSRELTPDQQHLWFDRDALSFFTEASSAKTLKSRVTDAQFPGWVAPKYVKTIDFMNGTLTQGRLSTSDAARKTQSIQYSLLVNDAGDKAVEIEVYPELKSHRVYVTVYRPADDIARIAQPIPHIPVPEPKPQSTVKIETKPQATIKVEPKSQLSEPVAMIAPAVNGVAATVVDVDAEPEAMMRPPAAKRPDFRRLNVTDHAPVLTARKAVPVKTIDEEEMEQVAPVPKFLTTPPKEVTRSRYLTLDEVLPPEIERVRCDIHTAKLLIDASVKRGVRVRDLLRIMTGLNAPAHDEVLFEMPLSDADYMQLAQRYQLKPDMRSEIRNRMMDELQKKLRKING